MLQLKEAAIPTTDPGSSITASTITSTTVQPATGTLYAKEIPTKPLCPINELPDNNKENSTVSHECSPDPPECDSG